MGTKIKPIWEIAEEIAAEIPDEMWAELPRDGSINYKHYLYGHPKELIHDQEATLKAA